MADRMDSLDEIRSLAPEVVQQIMEEMEEEVILPSTQWEQEE